MATKQEGERLARLEEKVDNLSDDVKPYTLFNETTFDFVASGCVWSGDSYGSTRAASMTAGVVYIMVELV